jgi:periplasmic divalent cation tolerance protein
MQQTDAFVVLLTTVPDANTGERLAKGLIDQEFAACINLLPAMTSFYKWQGKVECDSEQQLLIKTRRNKIDAIEQWLTDHHPYDVPELITLPISDSSQDYLQWLNDSIKL